jgi:hypothetical protein
MSCKGLHCEGCGGAGGVFTAIAVLGILGAFIYHVRRGVETGLEIGVYILAGLLVIAVAGLITYWRLRRSRRVRTGTALVTRSPAYLSARQAEAIPQPTARPQLDAADQHVHLHFDGMNPAEVAAILARMNNHQ